MTKEEKNDPFLGGLLIAMAFGAAGAAVTAFVLLLPALVRIF